MIDEVLTLMTNGSPMVAFAVYLIWSNNRSEKRLDEVNSNYNEKLDNILLKNKEELETLRLRHEKREDDLRERWQTVVSGLQKDREDLEKDILNAITGIQQISERLSTSVESSNNKNIAITNSLSLLDERVKNIDNKIQVLSSKKE